MSSRLAFNIKITGARIYRLYYASYSDLEKRIDLKNERYRFMYMILCITTLLFYSYIDSFTN